MLVSAFEQGVLTGVSRDDGFFSIFSFVPSCSLDEVSASTIMSYLRTPDEYGTQLVFTDGVSALAFDYAGGFLRMEAKDSLLFFNAGGVFGQGLVGVLLKSSSLVDVSPRFGVSPMRVFDSFNPPLASDIILYRAALARFMLSVVL